jgi:tetratricopeptide (TPR) repeat protein
MPGIPGIGDLETAVDLDAASSLEAPRREAPPLERGGTVGRYVVLDRIGSGGMGVVYAAYDPELDRKLALKLLLPELPGRGQVSEGHGSRLLREAQAMAKLSHPNVVTVHDVSNEDGRICIAMEFVEGGSLRQWMTEKPRGWREVLAMFEGAARGLAAAHAQGIVHRDFKPDNVMVDRHGRARVMDFGLARMSGSLPVLEPADLKAHARTSASDVELTQIGAVMGTPAYMSPEQFLGAATDGRSDQFGFCVALWEGLYGSRPHRGETFNDLALRISTGELETPTRSDVPTWVRNVVARGLRPDPAERWPSMEALLDALHRDPTRWRRRAAVAGGVGLLALGGLALHVGSRRATQAECERASREIERVWNDERAAEIEQAFAATQVVHASTTFAKTRPWLDTWAQRWSETHEAACLATVLEGERQPQLHTLTQQCLGDRELALEVLLESFATPSEGVVSSAVDAAAALPEIASCMDDAWLRRQPPRPEDAAEAARALEVRRLLARSEVLFADFDYTGAAELGRTALAAIESLSGRTLEARAQAILGTSLLNLGSYEDAAHELEAAYLTGLRRRDLEPATDAAVAMMQLLGARLRRHDEALHWGRLADVTAELVGDESFRLAERREVRGDVLLDRGDYDEAIADFEEALRIRLELLGEQHPFAAASRSVLSQAYLRAGRYEDAQAQARQAAQALAEAIGPLHPNTARARLNLADVLMARQQHAAAEAEIRASLEVLAVTVAPGDPVLATAHNNLGSVLAAQGRPEEALVELREALRLLRGVLGADHPNLGLILGNIATLLERLGRTTEAAAAAREAVQTFEKTTGAEHPQATQLRINWTDHLVAAGKLDEAETVLREGLVATEKAVGADDPRAASYDHALGVMLANAGRSAEARALLEIAWAIREQAEVEPLYRANTAWALARLLADDPARARTLALTARELFAGLQQTDELKAVDAWLAGTASGAKPQP